MIRLKLLVCLAAAAALVVPGVASAHSVSLVADPASLVNTTIGTSNGFDDFPGTDVPFGMIQWSPDTPSRPSGGGYEYTDTAITGFSLTHLSGPGCPAMGDVPILPTTGDIGSDPGSAQANFTHDGEVATPGYYKATAGNVQTELTSTTRSGMGRFTFPSGTGSNLLFKLAGGANGADASSFTVVNNNEVSGSVTSGHFCGADDTYTLYFDVQFDQTITANGTWQNQHPAKVVAPKSKRPQPKLHGKVKPRAPKKPSAGPDGAYVTFNAPVVQAKVGISYVSTDNAKANLAAENADWNFDTVRTGAHNAWNDLLGKIDVGGGTASQQRVFYTALYHALLHPNVVSDSNGQYEGFDNQVHQVDAGHLQYANYSGWDIYRSQVQLAAMLAPQQTSDSVRSMLNDYDQSGQLPKWALNNGETYVMVGDPADSIIADAYAFGARDFDTGHALQAMLAEATQTNNVRPGLNYQDQGYLPMDGQYGCCNFYGPVSTQLEYDTADYALSSFASALGDTADSAKLAARAQNWQNVFNPGSGFFQPKFADGTFHGDFSPAGGDGFVEADAYQYTPMVPFNIKGISDAAGGRDAWVQRLDGLMSNIGPNSGPANADMSNEPSIEIPWEYDYVGAPYKTQQAVRNVQQQLWPDAPGGVGNDDLGTMSAWYVWSALGMFPETPGTSTMALGSPVFPQAQVHMGNGQTLTITAPQAAPDAPYVQSLSIDGNDWSHAYLPPNELTSGGTLAYQLGTSPNTSWASQAADAPPSYTDNSVAALAFTQGPSIVNVGATASIPMNLRGLTGSDQTVQWNATASNGLSLGATSGSLDVPASGDATQQIQVTAPATEGRGDVTVTFTSSSGAAIPNLVFEVDSANPGAMWPYYNNAGISTDGAGTTADFDGGGYAYSATALAQAGLNPGGTVSADGLTYQWPNVAAGQLDNIQESGQTVPLPATPGASKIGVLGVSVQSNPGSQGDFTVTYTDGSTQKVHIGLSDWTLYGGKAPVTFGNTTVATMPYRLGAGDGSMNQMTTYVFSATASVDSGRTVQSITLPTVLDQGDVHVFAFALG